MTLTLGAFLSQDVSTVCLTVFEAVTGLFEALRSAAVTFNFVRHSLALNSHWFISTIVSGLHKSPT